MACIENRPRCGASTVTTEPLSDIVSIIMLLAALYGIYGTITGFPAIAAFLVSTFGVFGAVSIAGFVGGVGTFIVVFLYLTKRCNPVKGQSECVAGVVGNTVEAFSGDFDEFLPFIAMHDRIDVIVKSNYWNVVESGNAKVFCTDEDYPRKSAIIRCYYYTEQVCAAARGAAIGAALGAIVGMVVAALVTAALCVTVILCIFALILAALIASAAALAGAAIGGQIGKAISGGESPSDNMGKVISIGDLITIINGNMLQTGYDDGANVFWWVELSAFSGQPSDTIPNNPFSYCEIDDVFTTDACSSAIVIL